MQGEWLVPLFNSNDTIKTDPYQINQIIAEFLNQLENKCNLNVVHENNIYKFRSQESSNMNSNNLPTKQLINFTQFVQKQSNSSWNRMQNEENRYRES